MLGLNRGPCTGAPLYLPMLFPREQAWTRPVSARADEQTQHSDVGDKLKFIETDGNAPTQDYS